ncbi:MAG: hypothetical protein AAGD96_27560, partial [Chloroflexota bacterium]
REAVISDKKSSRMGLSSGGYRGKQAYRHHSKNIDRSLSSDELKAQLTGPFQQPLDVHALGSFLVACNTKDWKRVLCQHNDIPRRKNSNWRKCQHQEFRVAPVARAKIARHYVRHFWRMGS